jgi:hypothetical protein
MKTSSLKCVLVFFGLVLSTPGFSQAQTGLLSFITNLFSNNPECLSPNQESELLSERLNWNQCFSRSKIAIPAEDTRAQREALRGDFNVCDCLRDNRFESVKSIMDLKLSQNPLIPEGSQEYKQQRISNKAGSIREFAERTVSGISLQSRSITSRDKGSEDFSSAYQEIMFPRSSQSTSSRGEGNEGLSIRRGNKSLHLNLNVRDLSNVPFDAFEIDSVPQRVCLSMRDFHLRRSLPIPQDKDVFTSLLNKDFKPDDWSFDQLRDRYRRLMRKSPQAKLASKAEIQELKTKLTFLHRNPMIRFFMSSELKGLNDETKNRMNAKNFNLDAKKKDLFQQLKEILTLESCYQKDASSCLEKFNNQLRNFFTGNDGLIIANLTRLQIGRSIDDLVDQDEQISNPSQDPIQAAQMTEFSNKYGISRPENCMVDASQDQAVNTSISCLQKMSAYCRHIDLVRDDFFKQEDLSSEEFNLVRDTLEDDFKNDFNFNPQTNEDYQKANELACNSTPRDPSIEGLEEVVVAASRFPRPQRDSETSSSSEQAFSDPSCAPFCLSRRDEQNNTTKSFSSDELDEVDVSSRRISRSPAGDSEVSSGADSQATLNPQDLAHQNPSAPYFMGPTSPLPDEVRAQGAQLSEQDLARKEVQEELINELEQKVEEVKAENPSSPELAQMQQDLTSVRSAFTQSQMTNSSLLKRIQELERAQEILSRYNLTPRSAPTVENPAEMPSSTEDRRSSQALRSENQKSAEAERRALRPTEFQESSFSYASSSGRRRVSADSTEDAIRREESKLVRIDQRDNGSLTISSIPRSQLPSANGIAVEVPMAIYQNIQSNPEGIDLTQINLPPTQLDQVKDKPFTLLLTSPGSDQSIRVQVQIKNSRVVRVDQNQDGKPDRAVQTIRLNQLNLVFRPYLPR